MTKQHSTGKVFYSTIWRAFLCVPLGALGIALTLSIVGAPLGIPILLLCGKWIARPIQQHPNFRIATPEEALAQRQLRDGSYIEDQYMNTSQQYSTPSDWYNS